MKILHLEDDPDIRMIVNFALADFGNHTIIQGNDGLDGIKLIQSGISVDLFLLDVMMPRAGGEEFLRLARAMESYRSIPAIFMTARAQDIELNNLKNRWDAGLIVKPFDPMTLSDRIAEIIAGGS